MKFIQKIKFIDIFFIFFLILFGVVNVEGYFQIQKNLTEIDLNKSIERGDQFDNVKNEEFLEVFSLEEKPLSLISEDQYLSKFKDNEQYKKLLSLKKEEQLKRTSLQREDDDFSKSYLYIPGYIEKEKKVPIVLGVEGGDLYEELKKGIRLSPKGHLPNEEGITFIEGHSGQTYIGGLSYSYFDNLALYEKDLKKGLSIYIETEKNLYHYKLFKKEIIEPGEKNFYNSDFNHLILMTCYPRNTTDKRLLLHSKLIGVLRK